MFGATLCRSTKICLSVVVSRVLGDPSWQKVRVAFATGAAFDTSWVRDCDGVRALAPVLGENCLHVSALRLIGLRLREG
jgi:hypothetical protein